MHLQKYPAVTDILKRIKRGTVSVGVVEVREASPKRERGAEIRMSRLKQPGKHQEREVPRSWGRNELGVLEEPKGAWQGSRAE